MLYEKIDLDKYNDFLIFGVTLPGTILADALLRAGKKVSFFDNDMKKNGMMVLEGVCCHLPFADIDADLCVIVLKDPQNQINVKSQLDSLGIHCETIILSDEDRKHIVETTDDKDYLRCLWHWEMGREIDFDKPRTFNEKLQVLKLLDRDPRYTVMVDKYAVKNYVSEKIGSRYVIPALGLWDSFDAIDFSALPGQFVLKCTHDSGSVVVCEDKSLFDIDAVRSKFHHALSANYFYPYREWPYKNVPPRLMAEKFVKSNGGGSLCVYKFMCFMGVPKIIQVIQNDKLPDESIDYFDTEWNLLNMRQNFPNSKKHLPKPECLEEMLELAHVLSTGIRFLRVDFYEHLGHPLFSEFTFYSDAGFASFTPETWDELLGSWIDI